jgi:hypothetical protein
MFEPEERLTGATLVFRGVVLTLLVWLSVPLFTRSIISLGEYDFFLHRPSLIIHEAGHVIFGILGRELLTALGGSLLQVLFPVIIMVAFIWKKRDFFAAAAMAWWTGINLVDVAPYINDARLLQIQLLSGGTGMQVEGHDWEFILTKVGLIHQDLYIARAVLWVGRIIIVLAVVGAMALSWYQWKSIKEDEKD